MTKVITPLRDYYPSVTICSGPSSGWNIFDLLETTSLKTIPSNFSSFLGISQSLHYYTQIQSMKSYHFIVDDMNLKLNMSDIISGVFHEYIEDSPLCDRGNHSGRNLIADPLLWTTTIPHPWHSGICYTYKYFVNLRFNYQPRGFGLGKLDQGLTINLCFVQYTQGNLSLNQLLPLQVHALLKSELGGGWGDFGWWLRIWS